MAPATSHQSPAGFAQRSARLARRGGRFAVSVPGRVRRAVAGWRWARRSVAVIRADVRRDGLDVAVPPPGVTGPGSLKGARAALRLERASCLERSLVIQRWWSSNDIALDVIIGVRHPTRHDGAPGHAWVEYYDEDCSDRFAEIRRVPAPAGKPPKLKPRG